LAWNRPCADRGLSRPTSVFRTTIGVCKILSRSVEIWQYEDKNLFLSRNRERPSIGLAVNNDLTWVDLIHWRRCRRAPAARVVYNVPPMSSVHGLMSCIQYCGGSNTWKCVPHGDFTDCVEDDLDVDWQTCENKTQQLQLWVNVAAILGVKLSRREHKLPCLDASRVAGSGQRSISICTSLLLIEARGFSPKIYGKLSCTDEVYLRQGGYVSLWVFICQQDNWGLFSVQFYTKCADQNEFVQL